MHKQNLELLKEYQETVLVGESSLSRIWKHLQEFDCGFITASRSENTKAENANKNHLLKALMLSKGYGVTSVDGGYIENYGTKNEQLVEEDSFFVVDIRDSGVLKDLLVEQGEKWLQDSIIWCPKEDSSVYLIGTNPNDEEAYVKYHEEKELQNVKFGDISEFYTKVNNRPFIFESIEKDIIFFTERNQRMAASIEYKNGMKKLKEKSFGNYIFENFELSKKLCENASLKTGAVGMTAKMWILPNGKVESTGGQLHFDWAIANKKMLKDSFGISFGRLKRTDGEQEVRLKLISQGMFRVNYEQRSGNLIIEGDKKFFKRSIKDSIFYLVVENVKKIEGITINLFDGNELYDSESVSLFRYDPKERINHIPFISRGVF